MIDSYYGGGGLGVYNTALPTSLSAISAAYDMFLRNQQAELARGQQAIEGQKNRIAQKEAAKEQKKAQKKAQRKQLGTTLAIAGGGALLGGLGAAALAPVAAPAGAAGAGAASTSGSLTGAVGSAGAGTLGATAPTAAVANTGASLATGGLGASTTMAPAAATGGLTSGVIAPAGVNAGLTAADLAMQGGVVANGTASLAAPAVTGGAAAAGGSAVPLGAGIGATTGGASGLAQGAPVAPQPNYQTPTYNNLLQAGGYGVRPGAAGIGDRLGIFAGNFLGNFANSLAPGSGNAILNLPNINPQTAYQTGLGLTNLGMQISQNQRQDRLAESTIQHQRAQEDIARNPVARPLDPLVAERYMLQNKKLGMEIAGTLPQPMDALEQERLKGVELDNQRKARDLNNFNFDLFREDQFNRSRKLRADAERSEWQAQNPTWQPLPNDNLSLLERQGYITPDQGAEARMGIVERQVNGPMQNGPSDTSIANTLMEAARTAAASPAGGYDARKIVADPRYQRATGIIDRLGQQSETSPQFRFQRTPRRREDYFGLTP